MAYVITQTCCSDAACVSVCPVNCIHPTPEEADFGTAEQLYVNPDVCIDCGACADACPVDAVVAADRVTAAQQVFVEINRGYFANRERAKWAPPRYPLSVPRGTKPPRVAIVGSGPAAWYAAETLLREVGAEVTMIEKLPVIGGLLRYGVAPDHPDTKGLGHRFDGLMHHPRLHLFTNLEVGRDLTDAVLHDYHEAVIYAVGAAADRALDVPGEDLPGSTSATAFVAWYNAHPHAADARFPLDGERAVVVGTGNVAVDVTRLLVSDPAALAATDIGDTALAALRESAIREVVVLGRRGPAEASWSASELMALLAMPDVEVVLDDRPGVRAAIEASEPGSKAALLRGLPVVAVDWSAAAAPLPAGKTRRVVLRFFSQVAAVHGHDRAESVLVGDDRIETGLLLRALGYRALPVAGLPFDEATARVPHDRGRVRPGSYVVGWIKRGPTGGIGSNRTDSEETVRTLVADLPLPPARERDFAGYLRRHHPQHLGLGSVRRIHRFEEKAGELTGRPRVKLATVEEMLAHR